jgi:hypothetical protein
MEEGRPKVHTHTHTHTRSVLKYLSATCSDNAHTDLLPGTSVPTSQLSELAPCGSAHMFFLSISLLRIPGKVPVTLYVSCFLSFFLFFFFLWY